MDAMTYQTKMLCEKALGLIASIRSAIRNGRAGFAKDCLVGELKPMLKPYMGSPKIVSQKPYWSSFQKAYCRLPSGNTKVQDWEPGLYCVEHDLQSILDSIEEKSKTVKSAAV